MELISDSQLRSHEPVGNFERSNGKNRPAYRLSLVEELSESGESQRMINTPMEAQQYYRGEGNTLGAREGESSLDDPTPFPDQTPYGGAAGAEVEFSLEDDLDDFWEENIQNIHKSDIG